MYEPQVLATDLVIGESARWHDGRLWLSNWGAQEILAFDLEGHREVIHACPPPFRSPSIGCPTVSCWS